MDEVLFERRGSVALVTLNRPRKLNAMNRAMLMALADTFTEIKSDSAIRAVIVTGAGRAFSAGMDLTEDTGQAPGEFGFPDLEGRVDPLFPFRDPDFDTPVIAAVNGLAFGGGYFMFAVCDLAVVAESAVFEISEVRQAIVAGWSEGLQLGLPRPIAMELALGGRITGRRAYEVGLANDVVADDQLLDRAWDRAEAIAALPPLTARANRHLVGRLSPAPDDETVTLARRLRATSLASDDFREAMAAFGERRAPSFTGH